MKNEIARALVLGVLVVAPALMAGQQPSAPPPSVFPDLVPALKATEGCLGVETARTASGKQVIFAWFENKKAVLRWYNSGVHLASMRVVGAAPSPNPMAGVPEDGPVLAIASLTLAGQPQDGALPGVSQIAIELYQPVPGGVAAGGRFAPSTLKVPGLRETAVVPSFGR